MQGRSQNLKGVPQNLRDRFNFAYDTDNDVTQKTSIDKEK